MNDACVLLNKPNAYGSIFRFEGQASVFATEDGPCYRCLYPEPPPPGLVPSCAEGGVLGVLPGIVGCIQATETFKLILGIGRAAHRPLPDLRRAAHEVPRAEAAEGSGLPGVRHASDRDHAHRLRAVLRRAAGGAEPIPVRTTIARLRPRAQVAAGSRRCARRRRPRAARYQINRIPGSVLIPLGELPQRVGELDPSREIITQCKSGIRSAKAAEFLRQKGFRVKNLKGGILAWIDAVDPSQPKY